MPSQPGSPLVHLSLVPADSITASYKSGQLLLQASGEHVDYTRDINFHRLPFAGGLLFELHGWVGPVIHQESHYKITDRFNIDLPNRVYPSNTVVINTANKTGWVIPIQYDEKDTSQETRPDVSDAQFDAPELRTVFGPQTIVVPLDKPFTIQQSDSFKGQGGTINIAFDKNFSLLDGASIADGKIEWTFIPLQIGKTEVAVYVGQLNPPYVYRVNYEVQIVSLEESLKPIAKASLLAEPSNYTSDDDKATEDAGIPLSWDGFINIGYSLIKDQYSDAKLYEVDATPLTRQPVDNEYGLVNNRIVCGLDNNKTAIIQSNGWGSFGPIQVIPSPWLEDVIIPWPVALEIHDAFSILRKAGYELGVKNVTLRHPLSPDPEIDQPFFIFGIGNECIAVGVNDKKIYNFGASEFRIDKA